MSTEAERAVDDYVASREVESRQNLGNHDRSVHTCRCLAAGEGFADLFGIARRLLLLVLVLKAARIWALIPFSTNVLLRGIGARRILVHLFGLPIDWQPNLRCVTRPTAPELADGPKRWVRSALGHYWNETVVRDGRE